MSLSKQPPQPLDPSAVARRRILGAAAVAAAFAGAGVAWWRGQSSAKVSSGEHNLPTGFWDLRWDAPHGGSVSMHGLQGKPLLINFWATWCPPCVEELPLINAFFHKNKSNGWQVLGLAVDKLAPVQSFLKSMPLDFAVGMAGMAGAELGRELGNLAGGLPFSVVINSDGVVAQRKMGLLQQEDLDAWAAIK